MDVNTNGWYRHCLSFQIDILYVLVGSHHENDAYIYYFMIDNALNKRLKLTILKETVRMIYIYLMMCHITWYLKLHRLVNSLWLLNDIAKEFLFQSSVAHTRLGLIHKDPATLSTLGNPL